MRNIAISHLLKEELAIVQEAYQKVAIKLSTVNPFQPDADPNAVLDVTLNETGGKTFHVHLAYDAGKNGQLVRLKIAGIDPASLLIQMGQVVVPLSEQGEFDIKIAEGSRRAEFNLRTLGDFDTDFNMQFAAVLLDDAGVETHLWHNEATVRRPAVFAQRPWRPGRQRSQWAGTTRPCRQARLRPCTAAGVCAR